MSLTGSLSIANTGLAAINAQFVLLSQNIANASTPGYAVESAAEVSLSAGGEGDGVAVQAAQPAVDQALQTSLLQQNGAAAGLQTTSSALAAVSAVQGTPGQGQDLGSLLGALQDSFSTLLGDPSSQPQQQAVVQAASTLAAGINMAANTVQTQRQDAQDGIVSGISAVNADLATIGSLSDQIVAAQAQGISSADLQNQRSEALTDLSQYVAVNVLPQANGDVVLTTQGGVQLPIHGNSAPLSVASATVGAGSYYPGGGVPGIMLNGTDVTASLTGGQIAANVTLRDTTLPTYQAELDEFAQNMSAGFSSQGLPLFSNAAGTVPPGGGTPVQSGYVGYANVIQVNPAVTANPSAVRDGLPSTNTSSLAGYNTVISDVLTNVLGTASVTGGNVSGLGATGTLNAPFAPPTTLANFASSLITAQSADASSAASQLTTAQGLQTALQTKLSSQTGVNMDTEMSSMIALQNAYSANAKIVGAVQSMFSDMLNMVSAT